MIDMNLKQELLKQNGHALVNTEIVRLHETIDAERRRVRRLFRWTIGVWVTWFLLISVGLVVPYVLARTSPPAGAMTQPASQQPPARHQPSGINAVIGGVFGVVMFAVLFGLPVIGVILVVILILTHRTVGMNQIRASLGAIEIQLKALSASGKNPEETR